QELESKYGIKVIPKVLDVTNYDQVFEVFRAFKQEFGHLDRVIVNAGIGDGRRIGKGSFAINKATVETNFIS
ncbi:SDR family NAD(P)-dependent oxidoreductase, partial [Neisseria gonorrhoeae]